MQRVLEPELMDNAAQAIAYAEADFSEPHGSFIEQCQAFFGNNMGAGYALDLGCGPGDIAIRFARVYPGMTVHGVDGSTPMLACGQRILDAQADINSQVELIYGLLPGAILPRRAYDCLISNSLLHHLHDPRVLWNALKQYGRPGAPVFIMDLMRPDSIEQAEALVETYAADEPEILQRDFYNSLLAAFRPEEIWDQLRQAGLAHFDMAIESDRHLTISGRLRG
ncbi:MAG: class I SAM-dependent methyltransferase [Mariprofundaceae bacterium]